MGLLVLPQKSVSFLLNQNRDCLKSWSVVEQDNDYICSSKYRASHDYLTRGDRWWAIQLENRQARVKIHVKDTELVYNWTMHFMW